MVKVDRIPGANFLAIAQSPVSLFPPYTRTFMFLEDSQGNLLHPYNRFLDTKAELMVTPQSSKIKLPSEKILTLLNLLDPDWKCYPEFQELFCSIPNENTRKEGMGCFETRYCAYDSYGSFPEQNIEAMKRFIPSDLEYLDPEKKYTEQEERFATMLAILSNLHVLVLRSLL